MSYQSTVRKLKLKYRKIEDFKEKHAKLDDLRIVQKMLTNISQIGDYSKFTYNDVKQALRDLEK